MALIAVEKMVFYAYHGVHSYEKESGGFFEIDVYVHAECVLAAQNDDISETVDYEKIYRICKEEMTIKVNLLEHIAWRILQRVEKISEKIEKVKVRVSKLNPPIEGKVGRTFVEIEDKKY
ncbi:MAG: dihydroneopterin aldolase [Chitinophagales bacterium]|nr:dihydroneopterin aldolase [Bacteroidota bacterium]